MSEQVWKKTEIPVQATETRLATTVEGLEILIEAQAASLTWRVTGYLDEIRVIAHDFTYGAATATIAEAKAATLAAAQRLLAAGVHGEKRPAPAARHIEATAHVQAAGETDIGDTRALLVDPLNTIAGAFAARRADDDPAGESAWDAVERSYAEAQERAGDEEGRA